MLLDAVGRRFRQVVLVGSGMDTRAYRLDLPPQLKIVEIDEPEVHAAKEAVLAEAGLSARCQLRRISAPSGTFASAADLPCEALAEVLDVRKPSLFVLLDGVLGSWPADRHTAALAAVGELAGSGSRIIAQIRAPEGATAAEAALACRDALEDAGWVRIDVVGNKALMRLFRRAPPDRAALLVVAERGAAAAPPRRQEVDRGTGSSSSGSPAGPREVSL
eukprot:gnl/TRDRNA2_/TRDRNA2_144704_c1_seq1.p2 gnl/TRDRNA2_/TRDRNA2_144704_c1~~gnl/TRDRNA2_/TRDRNA2_144704_c1_seq1.p2  ORF type:complete len:232 (+),score=51.10 gnl/TRDRNA2_/TRDRNA2_144704_c1_seq1:42-698(+)